MEDKESGSLSQKAVLDLLVELYQGAVTGSLKLERAPLQKAVYFRDGQILFAASNDPKDQLASILVEEGKLGPDQMQVAQARVSAGNPLAKVLTELGYISQRELGDAARLKVEKILTDLYGWKEGSYQFATKSLPKGAIDLELSTPRLLFSSIRRIQDREWVLKQLDSLETVLAGAANYDAVLEEIPDPQATEILRLVDGVKSVKQIGALSSLEEFDVCKVLAAAVVVGALEKTVAPAAGTSDDAFSMPTDEESAFSPPPAADASIFANETLGIDTNASGPEPPPQEETIFQAPDDTVFQPSPSPSMPDTPQEEQTVFEPPPHPSGLPLTPPPPPLPTDEPILPRSATTASELLIDEPEPDTGDDFSVRAAPRPMRRGGRASSRGSLVKIAGVVALMGAAAFSVYYFVWPMFSSNDDSSASGGTSSAATTPSGTNPGAPPSPPASGPTGSPTQPPPSAATGTTQPTRGAAAGGSQTPTRGAAAGATPAPTPPPTQPAPQPPPRAQPTQPAPPRTTPTPAAGGSSGGGRNLLRSGNLPAAARAFQSELRPSANKITIAVGLYCNEANVGRIVDSAKSSSELYLLPADLEGRSCYRVIWGLFDTRQAAESAKGSLPEQLRAGDAAAVAISRILR